MPPDLLTPGASPCVFPTLSYHRLGRYASSKTVEIPSAMNLRNHSLSLPSNSRDPQLLLEFVSLSNILLLILFVLTMQMVFVFILPKCFAFSSTTTMRANKLSRVARKQETLPDTSVEVNPVPPTGWRRMAEPPGNKGWAHLEPDALEPLLSQHRSCPVYATQAGAEVEDPADASLFHCVFNHTSVDRTIRVERDGRHPHLQP